jgi:hypothetical protein
LLQLDVPDGADLQGSMACMSFSIACVWVFAKAAGLKAGFQWQATQWYE